jgi:hypothetical protein
MSGGQVQLEEQRVLLTLIIVTLAGPWPIVRSRKLAAHYVVVGTLKHGHPSLGVFCFYIGVVLPISGDLIWHGVELTLAFLAVGEQCVCAAPTKVYVVKHDFAALRGVCFYQISFVVHSATCASQSDQEKFGGA